MKEHKKSNSHVKDKENISDFQSKVNMKVKEQNILIQLDLNQQFYERKIGFNRNKNDFESNANMIETPKFQSLLPFTINNRV